MFFPPCTPCINFQSIYVQHHRRFIKEDQVWRYWSFQFFCHFNIVRWLHLKLTLHCFVSRWLSLDNVCDKFCILSGTNLFLASSLYILIRFELWRKENWLLQIDPTSIVTGLLIINSVSWGKLLPFCIMWLLHLSFHTKSWNAVSCFSIQLPLWFLLL